MISKKELELYNFESIEDYFNYIVESEINGQRSQVKRLIKEMSKPQRKAAYLYLNRDILPSRECKDVSALIFEQI